MEYHLHLRNQTLIHPQTTITSDPCELTMSADLVFGDC